MLNLYSVELFFKNNSDEQIGEAFVSELIALGTKYEAVINQITFKENE